MLLDPATRGIAAEPAYDPIRTPLLCLFRLVCCPVSLAHFRFGIPTDDQEFTKAQPDLIHFAELELGGLQSRQVAVAAPSVPTAKNVK